MTCCSEIFFRHISSVKLRRLYIQWQRQVRPSNSSSRNGWRRSPPLHTHLFHQYSFLKGWQPATTNYQVLYERGHESLRRHLSWSYTSNVQPRGFTTKESKIVFPVFRVYFTVIEALIMYGYHRLSLLFRELFTQFRRLVSGVSQFWQMACSNFVTQPRISRFSTLPIYSSWAVYWAKFTERESHLL